MKCMTEPLATSLSFSSVCITFSGRHPSLWLNTIAVAGGGGVNGGGGTRAAAQGAGNAVCQLGGTAPKAKVCDDDAARQRPPPANINTDPPPPLLPIQSYPALLCVLSSMHSEHASKDQARGNQHWCMCVCVRVFAGGRRVEHKIRADATSCVCVCVAAGVRPHRWRSSCVRPHHRTPG